MKAPVIAREIAEAEFTEWLESKMVLPSVIEDNQDSFKTIVEAIMYGRLAIDENKSLVHTLAFPLGEDDVAVTSLKYGHRINDKMIQKYTKGLSHKDVDGRVNATIAAMTNTARGIIEGLDSIDKKIANAITVFFF